MSGSFNGRKIFFGAKQRVDAGFELASYYLTSIWSKFALVRKVTRFAVPYLLICVRFIYCFMCYGEGGVLTYN